MADCRGRPVNEARRVAHRLGQLAHSGAQVAHCGCALAPHDRVAPHGGQSLLDAGAAPTPPGGRPACEALQNRRRHPSPISRVRNRRLSQGGPSNFLRCRTTSRKLRRSSVNARGGTRTRTRLPERDSEGSSRPPLEGF
jgi:hypothetical protein